MMKLSLSMIVKNEMECLERCLKAAAPFVEICALQTGLELMDTALRRCLRSLLWKKKE